ncbi:MAG: amidase [Anaerolineales bacterium]|nr:amidase [Anaerolineales bacterium]
MENKTVYDLKSVTLPYLSGGLLRLFASLVEGPLGGLLIPSLFESAGINWLRQQTIDESPTIMPIHFTDTYSDENLAVPEKEWPRAAAIYPNGFQYATVFDYAKAYRDGKTTPEEVAVKLLDAIEASNSSTPPLRAMIAVDRADVMKQAREATERIKAGRPLSIFDGVPVAVKDEVDMMPYPTTVGTSFLGRSPVTEDATIVARMRAAGALLIGKANMHEIGINVTGLNPHHGTTRNPYNTNHFTGGSSSGSATAVAAGFVPVAISADGGGSIRIPAAFCGVFGLKSTFGRVSEHGAAPLCWSVAHLGPIAGTATDTALAYAVMAGPDLHDPNTLHQPLPSLENWDQLNLNGLKLGVYKPWFQHADPEIVAACDLMLRRFADMGAEIVEINIPDLELNRIAHSVTILAEMAQAMSYTYDAHHKEHGLDVRLNLALARKISSQDYLLAQRARTRIIRNFNKALEQVDMIITPTTAIAAPAIPKDALPDGNSDLSTTIEIMRFVTAGNMTGLPAISFPVGYTKSGLPIGMQAMGRAWEEHQLLRLAVNAEKVVERKEPQVHFKFLD